VISREGAVVLTIITGTPTGEQSSFDTGTLRIIVDANIPFNQDETIFVVFKKTGMDTINQNI